MMLVSEFKKHFEQELSEVYPEEEIGAIFTILLENSIGLSRLDLALNPQIEVAGHRKREFEMALERLKQHEPIQYITGKTEFFGLDFRVNENVLIPRPETEELIDWVIKDVRYSYTDPAIRILDIGTGSGCIAVSIAKNLPEAAVVGIDISEQALELAEVNARKNRVKVDFVRLDILDPEENLGKFDLIVSNPPYVRTSEKSLMQPNVLDYEPHQALFVDDADALLFYRKTLDFAENHLSRPGAIYFEINAFMEADLKKLIQAKNGIEFTFKTDIFGKPRMLKLQKT